MININEYKTKFEKRCLAADLIKLNEPIDTIEFVYCAFEVIDEKDFEPAVQSLINCIKKEENGEFYRLDMYREGNIITMTSSRGSNLITRIK